MRSLLFPSLSRAFFRGLHTTNLSTCGLSRSYSQAAQVPSSKVTDKVPRSPAKNSRRVAALVSRMDSMTTLPLQSITATEMVAWCTSSPIYFSLFMRVLLFVGGGACAHNLLQKGRPFIMRFKRLGGTREELSPASHNRPWLVVGCDAGVVVFSECEPTHRPRMATRLAASPGPA